MSKYIMVTGGVCSSLGKGVASASIASLLECCGLKVTMIKCDPYINVDAGTMSPYQRGEVYVTDDGSETDMDLGNYSRFTNISLTKNNSVTIGNVYETVIQNERAGRYNGKTVQVIPHITDEIKRRIINVGTQADADVVIVEIGGTVGDIESIPFLEAARQLIREMGKTNAISVHLTLVPYVTGGEIKTKPTQHSVKSMQEVGIQPDILLCRTDRILDSDLQKKIALFCNVGPDCVFTSPDVENSVYELPVLFHSQNIDAKILSKLNIMGHKTDVTPWKNFLSRMQNTKQKVCIGMLGKKNLLSDCYKSVRESLLHAAITAHGVQIEIKKIDAENLESGTDISKFFEGINGIIVPGNYGQRGFLGMLKAVRFARENRIPYLGIDLGMQLMAIETARNLLQMDDADSTEFIQNTSCPIISLPEEQAGLAAAGILKLGSSSVTIEKGTILSKIYGKNTIIERHRSKYSFDKKYSAILKEKELIISAFNTADKQTEAFEWVNHPWGIGVQFHPEFTSRPTKPHPLFSAFIGAALQCIKH